MRRLLFCAFLVFLGGRVGAAIKPIFRPVSDLDTVRYVFMNADRDPEWLRVKKRIASFLPAPVELILYQEESSDKHDWKQEFSDVIAMERVQLVQIPKSGATPWARELFPIATWDENGAIRLVDSRDSFRVELDNWLASWLGVGLIRHGFYVNSANLIADQSGNCILAERRFSYLVPSSVYEKYYGCGSLVRLPYQLDAGSVDESVVILKSGVVATDNDQYEISLKKNGYRVLRLPKPRAQNATYANVIIVNGIVIMPVFGERSDAMAMNVYLNSGFTVFPVKSDDLAVSRRRSLRSLTMTYPEPIQAQGLMN